MKRRITAAWFLPLVLFSSAADGLAQAQDVRMARHPSAVGVEDDDIVRVSVDVADAAGLPARLDVWVEASDRSFALALDRQERLGAGLRVIIEDGGEAVLPAAAASYRGSVLPFGSGPIGRASATLTARGLAASIQFGDGSHWILEPLEPGNLGVQGPHVLRRRSPAGATSAGLPPDAEGDPEFLSAPATGGLKVVEIAIDTDVEYYQNNSSSVAEALADIELLMAGVNAIFEAEVGLTFEVSTVIVRTAEPDPYTLNSAAGLLNQLKGHWSSTKQEVKRDLVHMLSGKDLDNDIHGIALNSTICNPSGHYSVAETTFSTVLAKRVALTAHQLGHTFGANDCDNAADCQIMCSIVNGCGGGMTGFAKKAESTIIAIASSASCLHPEPAPVALPFLDEFPDTSLSAWMMVDGATVDTGAVSPPSDPLALLLAADGGAAYQSHEIRTARIDASAAQSLQLSFDTEHRGVENGEALVVEYSTGGVVWAEVLRVTSNGVDQAAFVPQQVLLPVGALADRLQLRFRTEVDSADDRWYIDDVRLLDVDVTPPGISKLTLGAASWQIGKNLTVSCKVTDDKSGVQSVIARVRDGATVLGQISLAPSASTYSGTLLAATAGTTERSVDIEIEAQDAQANVSQLSTTITVFDKPTFPLVDVTPAVPTDVDAVLVAAQVVDSSGLEEVSAVFKLGNGSSVTTPMTLNQSTGRHEATFPATGAGDLSITLKATDSVGNVADPWKKTVKIWPSVGEAPQITSLVANPDPLEIGLPLLIDVKVKDADSPPLNVTAVLRQGASGLDSVNLVNTAGGSQYVGTLTLTAAMTEGTYQVDVTAADLQGNVHQKSFDLQCFEAPVVSGLAVAPAAPDSTEAFAVSALVNHPSGIAAVKLTSSLNGQALADRAMTFNPSSGRYEAAFTAVGKAGSFQYTVIGTSNTGHANSPAASGATIAPAPLTVSLIKPIAGSVGGGTILQVLGDGFVQDADVGSLQILVDGQPATDVEVVSDHEVTALSPAGDGVGLVDVVVRANKGGALFQDTLTNGFKYGVPPALDASTPASGSAYGPTQIALFGSGLAADGDPLAIEVRIGTRASTVVKIINDQALFAIVPGGGDPGVVEPVSVITPYGSATLVGAFTNQGIALSAMGKVTLPSAAKRPSAVAYVGDMNADQLPDIAVGLPNGGSGSKGEVRILDPVDLATLLTVSPVTSGAVDFGQRVVAVPDLDGDGKAELVITDPGALSAAGRVELFTSNVVAVQWTVNGSIGNGKLGAALVDVGDLNGDGRHDLAVGAPGIGAGEVWLLDGQSGAQFATLSGTLSGEKFGAVLAARVPTSGSSHRLAAGAPDALAQAGRVYLYRIEAGSLTISPATVFDGLEAGAAVGPFGSSLSVALLGGADLKDDQERVAIGFPGSDLAGVDAGQLRLVREGSSVDVWAQSGVSPGIGFGANLAAAGLFDADEHRDLVVAAPGEGGVSATAGGSVLVLSGASGARAAGFHGDRNNLRLGLGGVAAFTDLDFDGMPEVIALSGITTGADDVWRQALHPASVTLGAAAGDSLAGKVPDPAEYDGLRFDMTAGEQISFQFTPDKKAKNTPFQITLLDESGKVLRSSDSAAPFADPALAALEGKKLTFSHQAIADGTVFLVIGNRTTGGAAGYALTSKRTSSNSLVLPSAVLPYADEIVPLEHLFVAPAGAAVGGLVTTSGDEVEVVDLRHEPADLSVFDAKGAKTGKSGDVVKLKAKKLKLPYSGDYRLFVQPGDGAGEVTIDLKLTLPSGKAKHKD